jgi:hypothetical protein
MALVGLIAQEFQIVNKIAARSLLSFEFVESRLTGIESALNKGTGFFSKIAVAY